MDKIICLGRNYLDHAKEMGGPVPEKPVLFLKPPSILRSAAQDETIELKLPINAGEIHHEVEIVLRLDRGGSHLTLSEAEKTIGAVSLGLDMTLRDRQAIAKKSGHPWTTAKVFEDSAVVGPWLRMSEYSDFLEQKFSFSLNGEIKQQGFGKDMRLLPAQAVAYISEFFPLCPGDLIFTGTPAGVGPVSSNQRGSLVWGAMQYNVLWKNA